MDNQTLILIVEDDTVISNFLADVLKVNNYNIMKSYTGKEAISAATSYCPDLILLDLGLPDMDGLDVIKSVRNFSDVPIIVVSAHDREREKVEAFDLGADDYVTKPFGTAELLARIRTELRHSVKMKENIIVEPEKTTIKGLEIDNRKRVVKIEGKDVHLTPVEYKLVLLLSRNAGKVLTHDFIIKEIWGPYISDNQILRVNMANIRRKIEKDSAYPKYILTDVGVGYRMNDEE